MVPFEADDSQVIPLNLRLDRWQPAGRRGVALAVADGVIQIIRSEGGDLRLSGGDLHIREAGGGWRVADRGDLQKLKCLVSEGVETLDRSARISVVTSAWRRLLTHPKLFVPTPHHHDDDELLPSPYTGPRVCCRSPRGRAPW